MTEIRWNWRRGALACALLLAAGCGLMDAPGTPRVVAHRSGSGNFPENSRAAVSAALQRGYAGLEVDLAVPKDRVPVLSHEPWLAPELCTRADGSLLPEGSRTLIRDLTLEELWRDYRCGGLRDPARPEATLVADTHMTFDELLEALEGHPDVLVHLDIKQDPAWAWSEEEFATAILARWNAAALPNPWYISSTRGELIKAFKSRQQLQALLVWPTFSADTSEMLVAISNELGRTVGTQELVQLARQAGADGIAVAFQVSDRAALEAVRQAGLKTALYTVNSETQLATFCRWPLDYLITDYVERAPCH